MSEPAHRTFLTDELVGMDGYKLLTGLVVPRPIGWIGSRSSEGINNLAPYSFFNAVSGDPPTVVFSAGAGGRKDSRDNVKATGVFSVNIVTADLVAAMNESAATIPTTDDEFSFTGLTPMDCTLIDAPMVAEAKARLECRLTHDFHIGRQGGGNWLFVGEVVAFHVLNSLLDGTRVDQVGLDAVGRHAGGWYSHATDLFDLVRPD